jgi:hypothetical protein
LNSTRCCIVASLCTVCVCLTSTSGLTEETHTSPQKYTNVQHKLWVIEIVLRILNLSHKIRKTRHESAQKSNNISNNFDAPDDGQMTSSVV